MKRLLLRCSLSLCGWPGVVRGVLLSGEAEGLGAQGSFLQENLLLKLPHSAIQELDLAISIFPGSTMSQVSTVHGVVNS